MIARVGVYLRVEVEAGSESVPRPRNSEIVELDIFGALLACAVALLRAISSSGS